MRWLPALLLLVAAGLAPPLAGAQTIMTPLCMTPPGSTSDACDYDRVYVVMGRILDKDGQPAKGARVEVSIHQTGVRDADGQPPTERGVANCKGDFAFAFRGLAAPSATGVVRVRVMAADGGVLATGEQALDPFFRRNDLALRTSDAWTARCAQQPDPAWDVQVSVTGRIVNRTEPYFRSGTEYHAESWEGHVGLYFWDNNGNWFCPPNGRGGCEPIATDELGNFKYTWTFGGPVDLTNARVELVLPTGKSFNATVDPVSRLAVHHVEASGRGPPQAAATPGLGALAVLAAAIVAVGVARSRRV